MLRGHLRRTLSTGQQTKGITMAKQMREEMIMLINPGEVLYTVYLRGVKMKRTMMNVTSRSSNPTIPYTFLMKFLLTSCKAKVDPNAPPPADLPLGVHCHLFPAQSLPNHCSWQERIHCSSSFFLHLQEEVLCLTELLSKRLLFNLIDLWKPFSLLQSEIFLWLPFGGFVIGNYNKLFTQTQTTKGWK